MGATCARMTFLAVLLLPVGLMGQELASAAAFLKKYSPQQFTTIVRRAEAQQRAREWGASRPEDP
jgi:hypothetical protein